MRNPNYVILAAFLVCSVAGLGQKNDWLPITSQDQQIKEVPGNPGAPAIQLYYYQDIDDATSNNESERVYQRIKILNDKGKKFADVEIIVPPGCRVVDLKARTIHPDGKIIDFSDKPFDKLLVKAKGFKVLGKAFTMPDVTVGSIVEYRYKLDYPPNVLPFHEWSVQHELYTVKESFRIRAYTGRLAGAENGSGLSAYPNLPPNMHAQAKGDVIELEGQSVPAFEAEPNMPPEQSYLYRVSFFYGGMELRNPDIFWQTTGTRWYEATESFIGNGREAREDAATAIGSESDPEKKLRLLYHRAQQIRNLTYERGRTEEEQKKENLKPNKNVSEALSRGYGDREDITRAFIAMARASGFEAALVKVSNRSVRLFNKNILTRNQLDNEIADVTLNGQDIFLDPGTRFCPFGLLRWPRTSTKALRLAKGGGAFVDIPAASRDKAVIERSIQGSLDNDGNLKAEITVLYKGSEALERRLDALESDEAGRKKSLEDEVKGWLPSGITVILTDSKNWEESEQPLEAHFSVVVSNFASVTGKRLLVPVCLFQSPHKNAFKTKERRYPVYFPYAYTETDLTTISAPAGYSVETAPQAQKINLPMAVYQNETTVNGQKIEARRVLSVNGIFFRPDQYSDVRNFFGQVQSGDDQQVVFTGGSVRADKSN